MTSTRILFIALLAGLFASCKPSPAIELTQDFTGKKWELQNLEIFYNYEIEERYVKNPNTNFRYVDQVGTISLRYSRFEGEGIWEVSSYYTREQETQTGNLPTETFSETDIHTGITGIWEFMVSRGGQSESLIQEYFETQTGCNLAFDFAGDWKVRDSENFDDPNRKAIIEFDIAHLRGEDFAGDLVFYPTIFERPGYLPVIAKADVENFLGQEVLGMASAYEADGYELRSKSFEDDDYGSVEVEEKLRTIHITAVFHSVEDDPC